jgi:Amt family ammonium transporter
MGFAAAVVCNRVLQLKNRLGLDDTLDVLLVPDVAVLLGTLLTGVLALQVLNPAGADGLITGRFGQLWIQIRAAGFTIFGVGVGTYAVLKAIGAFMPMNLTDAQERQGLCHYGLPSSWIGPYGRPW